MPFGVACMMAVANMVASVPPVEMTPDEIADHLLRVRQRHDRRFDVRGRSDVPVQSPSPSFVSRPEPQSGISPLAVGVAAFIGATIAQPSSSDSGGGYVDSGSWSSSE